MSDLTERDLRFTAILGGCILASVSACFGVDGMLHAGAGALIGFGVGRGLSRARGVRALKEL